MQIGEGGAGPIAEFDLAQVGSIMTSNSARAAIGDAVSRARCSGLVKTATEAHVGQRAGE